jgi:hypothetical protein
MVVAAGDRPTTHQATATQMIEHTNAFGGSNTIGNVTGFGLGADCECIRELERRPASPDRERPAGPAAQCPTSPDRSCRPAGRVRGRHVGDAEQSARAAGLAG